MRQICAFSADRVERLDAFLSRESEWTRSHLVRMIEEGSVTVNRQPVSSKNYRLKPGDEVVLTVPQPKELAVEAENIPLDIVYEDNDLLVVNKPKGMVVHPAPGNLTGTLVNALLYHCRGSLSGIGGVMRPGIVHRIDKDTSGLLMVAKNDHAHLKLSEQIREHSFLREYEAVVYGKFREPTGTVDAPIGRHPVKRKQMAVVFENSKPAVTHYTVVREGPAFSHLRLRLETGRTHQIRVHMAYLGHPVAGDPVYGPRKCITELNGQCLHAKKIGFIHPVSGRYLEFDSPLPPYFVRFLERNFPNETL